MGSGHAASTEDRRRALGIDDAKASDLVSVLAELGNDGWELVGVDTNVSYGQAGYSYVGSLYIFQRPS